jgi:hypothetical protein
MANHIEDEEKVGTDEDTARVESADMPEKPSDKILLKALLEDKKDEEEEEKKSFGEKNSDGVIVTEKRVRR